MALGLPISDRPIVILGMHRSGTSLLARLFSRVGIFMGEPVTGNHESVFFQTLNRDFLDMLGCSWAHVEFLPSVPELLADLGPLRRAFRKRLSRDILVSHFGSPQPDPARAGLWGWKDPRNCLTLPFFRDCFPRARVVFIHRDPRDAALSLVTRDAKRYDAATGMPPAVACRRFQHYLALWEQYNERALRALELFDQTSQLAYDRLVRSPADELRRVLREIDVRPPEAAIADACADVRADRVNPFRGPEGDPFRDVELPAGPLWRRWYGDGGGAA